MNRVMINLKLMQEGRDEIAHKNESDGHKKT